MLTCWLVSHYLDPAIRERSPSKHEHPAEWPRHGGILIKNVFVKYTSGTPDALQDVCLSVRPGEKLGIVGRTGAGKSSLVKCLMRIVEYSGTIEIDGYVDVPIGDY